MFRLKCRGDENEREFPFGVRMQPDQARPLFWFWFADDEICGDFTLLGTLSKPRRRRQRGHGKTKDLIGRTIAQRVRFKTLYIS